MSDQAPHRLLALEAATRHVSVACLDKGTVVARRSLPPGRQHSERLLPLVDACLTDAGWTLSTLSGLAVTRGPGAFTSVRVTLATAQGLAVADHLPLYGAGTLETIAFAAKQPKVLVLLDAKKKEVYAGLYSFETGIPHSLTPECVCPFSDLLPTLSADTLALGDGALLYQDTLKDAGIEILSPDDPRHAPDAAHLGALIFAKLQAGQSCPGPDPAYLRLPEAEVNWRKQRSLDTIASQGHR